MSGLELFLFLLAVLGVYLYVKFRRAHREQSYRFGPAPKRRVYEVLLPSDIADSQARSQRFLKQMWPVLTAEVADRAKGEGQLDIIQFFVHEPGHTVPTLRCLILTDQRQGERMKKTIRNVFDGVAVNEIGDDPFAAMTEIIRAHTEHHGEDDGGHHHEPELAGAHE